jgi:hypothetical protein
VPDYRNKNKQCSDRTPEARTETKVLVRSSAELDDHGPAYCFEVRTPSRDESRGRPTFGTYRWTFDLQPSAHCSRSTTRFWSIMRSSSRAADTSSPMPGVFRGISLLLTAVVLHTSRSSCSDGHGSLSVDTIESSPAIRGRIGSRVDLIPSISTQHAEQRGGGRESISTASATWLRGDSRKGVAKSKDPTIKQPKCCAASNAPTAARDPSLARCSPACVAAFAGLRVSLAV